MSEDLTIYHNPDCSTSRKTLALLREKGLEPKVVEYLKAGWSADELRRIIRLSGGAAKDLLRQTGGRAEALGLTAPDVDEETLIAAMVAEPALVNRPIVVTPKGAALCRPVEKALELL